MSTRSEFDQEVEGLLRAVRALAARRRRPVPSKTSSNGYSTRDNARGRRLRGFVLATAAAFATVGVLLTLSLYLIAPFSQWSREIFWALVYWITGGAGGAQLIH